jgi:hypothetical protein
MIKRWGISIDIEGFSSLYEESEEGKSNPAIWALHQLMDAIIKIGTHVYLGDHDRICAHQFGDGFIIVSDSEESDSSRCIAIATSLMRHMTMNGFAAKAAISIGDLVSITGCYPNTVRFSKCGTITLGRGVLTTIPVMGTTLTKAYKLLNHVHGNVLVVDQQAFESIPDSMITSRCEQNNCFFIEWRTDSNQLAHEISKKSGLDYGDRKTLLSLFEEYIQKKPRPPESWISSSRKAIKSVFTTP